MADSLARKVAQQVAVDICRELYDSFAMGGLEPQDCHWYVGAQINEALAPMREALQATKDALEKVTEALRIHGGVPFYAPNNVLVNLGQSAVARAAEVLKGGE